MAQPGDIDTERPLAYQVDPFCRSMGISRATFYKLVNEGKLRAVRIGGRTLVPATEGERLLSEAEGIA
jgi:excisionase family DNA binding protein